MQMNVSSWNRTTEGIMLGVTVGVVQCRGKHTLKN
jgi:hypothetical protein